MTSCRLRSSAARAASVIKLVLSFEETTNRSVVARRSKPATHTSIEFSLQGSNACSIARPSLVSFTRDSPSTLLMCRHREGWVIRVAFLPATIKRRRVWAFRGAFVSMRSAKSDSQGSSTRRQSHPQYCYRCPQPWSEGPPLRDSKRAGTRARGDSTRESKRRKRCKHRFLRCH